MDVLTTGNRQSLVKTLSAILAALFIAVSAVAIPFSGEVNHSDHPEFSPSGPHEILGVPARTEKGGISELTALSIHHATAVVAPVADLATTLRTRVFESFDSPSFQSHLISTQYTSSRL